MFSDENEARERYIVSSAPRRKEEKDKVIQRGAIFMEKTGFMDTETFYELLGDNVNKGTFVLGKLKSRDDLEVTEEKEFDLKTLMKMELMKKIEGTARLSSPTKGGKKRKSRKLKKSSKRKSRKARKSHKKRR